MSRKNQREAIAYRWPFHLGSKLEHFLQKVSKISMETDSSTLYRIKDQSKTRHLEPAPNSRLARCRSTLIRKAKSGPEVEAFLTGPSVGALKC